MACLRNLVGLLFDKCEVFAVIDSMNLREGCSKPSIKVPTSIIFVFWSMANQNMKIFEKLTDLHVLTPLRASNIQYFFFNISRGGNIIFKILTLKIGSQEFGKQTFLVTWGLGIDRIPLSINL